MEAQLGGHVAVGLAFCVIGLWHLFNHTKTHSANPKSYVSLPWFPTKRGRYLELYFIMFTSFTYIATELFVAPQHHHHHHHPLHLHNLEHAAISLSIFAYAFFAVVLDKLAPPAARDLTHMLGAVMLALELLLFHVHSTDHVGLEGQYHWLLQLIILTALAALVIGINRPVSFLIGFTRSLAVFSQGVWLIVIGLVLYAPTLVPEGCLIGVEDGRSVVKCDGEEALRRAKSLANILFGYYVVAICVVGVLFYLVIVKLYGNKVEYQYIDHNYDEQEPM